MIALAFTHALTLTPLHNRLFFHLIVTGPNFSRACKFRTYPHRTLLPSTTTSTKHTLYSANTHILNTQQQFTTTSIPSNYCPLYIPNPLVCTPNWSYTRSSPSDRSNRPSWYRGRTMAPRPVHSDSMGRSSISPSSRLIQLCPTPLATLLY